MGDGSIFCNRRVETTSTGIKLSGFHHVFKHSFWQNVFWIISNHLAVGLHSDSSLSKASVLDVETPDNLLGCHTPEFLAERASLTAQCTVGTYLFMRKFE